MAAKKLIGKWQIYEMDQYDTEKSDHIEFCENQSGFFEFGCVQATMDCRDNTKTGKIDFTFHGIDEEDEVFGRGWVKPVDGELLGFICFHDGDETGFKAKMVKEKSKKSMRA